MITYKEKAVIYVPNNFLVFDSELLDSIKHILKSKTYDSHSLHYYSKTPKLRLLLDFDII